MKVGFCCSKVINEVLRIGMNDGLAYLPIFWPKTANGRIFAASVEHSTKFRLS
jgi:hypothetical protein